MGEYMKGSSSDFLIIDSSLCHGDTLRKILDEKGISADIAGDIPEAGRLLSKNRYSCVLIDSETSVPLQNNSNFTALPETVSPVFYTGIGSDPISSFVAAIPADGYVPVTRSAINDLLYHIEHGIAGKKNGNGVICNERTGFDTVALPLKSRDSIVDHGLTILTHRHYAGNAVKELATATKTSSDSYGIFLCDITAPSDNMEFELLSIGSKVHSYLDESMTASGFLAEFNAFLARTCYSIDFATATVIIADTSKKEARIAGAGYRALAFRPWGRARWRFLETKGIPLGIKHDFIFSECILKLKPGDKLIALSEDYLRLNDNPCDGDLTDEILAVLDQEPRDSAPDEIIGHLEEYVTSSSGRNRGNSTAILLQF